MSQPSTTHRAPRPTRVGARCGGGGAWVVAWLVVGGPLAAQEPPDSLQLPDSLQVPDSAQIADLEALADSVSADTIFYNLPSLDSQVPSGFATGVWEWDRDAIMASGANTVAELVAEVPGLISVWGGDYGAPAAISAFGLGGGGYRVFLDGFEAYPLDGGIADLQRMPLVGLSRVRLDRALGAMTIEMWSYQHDDGRPFSVVEAGTGDLDTNTFRGVFADPTALGGSVAVGLERADTRGVGTEEGGNRTGSWVRYQLHLRERAGIALDFRRSGSQTKVPIYAPNLSRTDLALRGRLEVVDGVVAEAYTGKSSLNAEDAGQDYALYGGSRSQHGFRLALERSGVWARGGLRLFGGNDLPTRAVDVAGGFTRSGLGGVAGAYRQAAWMGTSTSNLQARGWLGPFLGLSAFGSFETGTYGSRDGPVLDGVSNPDPPFLPRPTQNPPGVAVADRETVRVGGSLSAFGITLAGALLTTDSDLLLPFATELDYGSPTLAGERRTGYEGWGSIPVPIWESLRLEGSYQRWDIDGPFLPRQIYRASLEYHQLHMDSGNLELWFSIGVRGHDPMSVFVADDGMGGPGGLGAVPFYQNWYGRIQVRVVTVRLFFGWDNFTLRRNLQTIPDRPLPFARSLFALRWDMWN